jgi:SRSO17 transposase
MTLIESSSVEYRMAEYLTKVGHLFGNKRRRASFAIYAMGLMGDGERKSAEPIATRACANPALVDAYHQRLTYFLSESEWSDAPVRRFAARYALEEMTKLEPVSTWIIDNTAFPKQGTHSVGVQRQSTGSGGKSTNCQIGISLTVATPSEHLPIDFELYLPRRWSDDPARRTEAHIPDEVGFETRAELAMQMIRRALADEFPVGVVLADSAYGDSGEFRRELREHGLDYAVGVPAHTTVCPVDESGGKCGQPMSVGSVGHAMRAQFRKVGWREGRQGQTGSRFASCRVRAANCMAGGADEEEVWLLMERPPGETSPCKFWLVTLPRCATSEQLVHLVKERHRTERVHEDLKDELGLDHFEGRTYRGWHHHVTVVLACSAFTVAERVRRSSLQRRQDGDEYSIAGTIRTPFPPLPDRPAAILLTPHCDLVAQGPLCQRPNDQQPARRQHAHHPSNST